MRRYAAAGLLALAIHALGVWGWRTVRDAKPSDASLPAFDAAPVELSLAKTDAAEDVNVVEPESVPAAAHPADDRVPEPDADVAVTRPAVDRVETPPPADPLAPEGWMPEAPPPSAPAKPARDTAKVDVPPKPQTAFRPQYPAGARRRGESGTVTVAAEVSAAGTVERAAVDVTSGYPELDRAACAAVRRARFVPAQRDGRVVRSTVRIPIVFTLH